MAFTLRLYTFSKRPNSTKQPSSGGTDYQVTLIEETSLMNPTFKLSIAANPIHFNYAFCYEFDRYYFITDITSYQNFWYISCKCDVLASWKTEIGAGSHYVLRSASDYNGEIIDNYYPGTADMKCAKYVSPNPLAWGTSEHHSYVMGIIGYAPNSYQQIGSITYYHMDETALRAFIYYLMHDVQNWSDIATAEYDPAVQEALLNPMQYIVSCIALPVDPPTGNVGSIYFGYYRANISTGYIAVLSAGSFAQETTAVSKAAHPQAASRGIYMNGAPYTSLVAHFGPFGDIELDPALCLEADQIVFQIRYDLIQGIGRLAIYPSYNQEAATGKLMYVGAAQIGVPLNLTQVLKNPLDYTEAVNNAGLNFAGSALSLVQGNLSGFTNALSAVNTGLADATRLKFPNVSGKGTTGSFLTFFDDDYSCYLKESYFIAVDDNVAENGRPLCEIRQINTLSGFILCQNADCQISGTSDEADQVNAYMNTGFFYE